MIKRVLSLSLLFTLLITVTTFAQQGQGQQLGGSVLENINFQDFDPVQATDATIGRISRQAEREGYTVDDLRQFGLLQGMTPQEVTTLVTRVQRYRQASGGATDPSQLESSRFEDLRALTAFYDVVPFAELAAAGDSVVDSLRIFGMDAFTQTSATFESSLNNATPANYQLGPGDEILIEIYGANQASYQSVVNPDGVIMVPDLGPIQVSGLSMDEARMRILNRLTSNYSGLNPNNQSAGSTYADISLGNIRLISVGVFGEVNRPGIYPVSSLYGAFNVLYAAGGPKTTGTFRDVRVMRGDSVIATIDLYDFLIDGDSSENVTLRNDDVIHVGTYKNRVYVSGESKRVGYFELLDGETFSDFVRYFGGFTTDAYTENFYMERTTPTMRQVLTIEYPEDENTVMRHGDKVRVNKVIERYENRVSTRGAFMRPGNFEWNPGMTLYELIELSGGLKEEASRERGIINRLNDNRESSTARFNPSQVINNPGEFDILLRPDDVVEIRTIFELREDYVINISGPVNNPGQYPFSENLTVEDAIYMAGGFRDDAATYNIEVARRVTGGNTVKEDNIADRIFFNVDEDLTYEPVDPANEEYFLQPFDQIYVRGQANYQSQMTVEIVGEVQVPGVYPLANRQARISDLLEWAGGPSAYANVPGARLYRRNTDSPRQPRADLARQQAQQRAEMEQMGADFQAENNINQYDDNMDGVVADTLSQLPREPVAIRLDEILANPGGPGDLILLPDDRLDIPTFQQTVEITGQVNRPVSVRFQPGQSLSHYVDEAGGLTENARRSKAYVIYANGEVERAKKFLFFRNDPEVRPGAEVVIPRKPNRERLSTQEIIAISSSVASTALLFVTLIDRIQN